MFRKELSCGTVAQGPFQIIVSVFPHITALEEPSLITWGLSIKILMLKSWNVWNYNCTVSQQH